MPRIRVFTAWKAGGAAEIEVPEGVPLRKAIADHFGVLGEKLCGVWRDGTEVSLDSSVSSSWGKSTLELAVSFAPIVYPFALFSAPSSHAPAFPVAGQMEPQREPPPEWDFMPLAERQVTEGLARRGISPSLQLDRLKALLASFPGLPSGYQQSPYRFLLSVAFLVTDEGDCQRFSELDTELTQAARDLWQRLQIKSPDALDLRLHLFLPFQDRRKLLNILFPEGSANPDPDLYARAHSCWRRVFIHSFQDDKERLDKLANLARCAAVERADPALRGRFQTILARLDIDERTSERWLDHQSQVALRPVEEGLRLQAERLVLERLDQELFGGGQALASAGETMRQEGLGLLRRAGFFEGLFTDDGPRLGEIAWEMARKHILRKAEADLGTSLNDSDSLDWGVLKVWLEQVLETAPEAGFPFMFPDDFARLLRTLGCYAACRLRFQVEAIIEQRTFPPFGSPDLSFRQMIEALQCVRGEIEAFRNELANPPERPASTLHVWLLGEEARLRKLLDTEREMVRNTARPLFSWWRRLLLRFGVGRAEAKAKVSEALQRLQKEMVQFQMITRFLASGLDSPEYDLDFPILLLERFRKLADEIIGAKQDLLKSNEKHDQFEAIGTLQPFQNKEQLEGSLKKVAGDLELTAIFRDILRQDGRLRDLFALRPEAVLADFLQNAKGHVIAGIRGVVKDQNVAPLDSVLPAALTVLFNQSYLRQTGKTGMVGALDSRTTLTAMVNPGLRALFPDLEERIARQLQGCGVTGTVPINVLESPNTTGVILIRNVHALDIEEVL